MIAIFKKYNGDMSVNYFKTHRQMHLSIDFEPICQILLTTDVNTEYLLSADQTDETLIYVCVITDVDYNQKIVLYSSHERLTDYLCLECEEILEITPFTQTFKAEQIWGDKDA